MSREDYKAIVIVGAGGIDPAVRASIEIKAAHAGVNVLITESADDVLPVKDALLDAHKMAVDLANGLFDDPVMADLVRICGVNFEINDELRQDIAKINDYVQHEIAIKKPIELLDCYLPRRQGTNKVRPEGRKNRKPHRSFR